MLQKEKINSKIFPFVKGVGGFSPNININHLLINNTYKMLNYNKDLKNISRVLRNNMTPEEVILWSKLKNKQLKNKQFYRQKTIGNYIVDFYSSQANLIIELDGSQHYKESKINLDKQRDDFLKDKGLKVLRSSNNEIRNNLNGVLEKIYENL